MNSSDAARPSLAQSNAESLVEVTRAELPLHCPTPATSLWNSHPKVYIPLEETPEARCHYCGTVYRLVERISTGVADTASATAADASSD